MYYSYFGFSENPFNLTPDPRYLYLSGYHKDALDHLVYGIEERKGFIAVTGGIGTGKTTLCRALLRQLDENTKSALVFSSFITDLELLQKINQEFGIEAGRSDPSKKELMDDLNAFLLEIFALGGNAVVLIDEAQNLPHSVLEQLRMLSNLETEKEKLLQIVLVGQPELAELLSTPSLRQLDERITVRYHLKPLGKKDVEGYVKHRLAVAGSSGRLRFTGSALTQVHRFSEGNPRRINSVCDRALLIAYARETFTVNRGILSDAVKDLRGGMIGRDFRGTVGGFSKQAFVLASLLLILAWVVWQGAVDMGGRFIQGIRPAEKPASIAAGVADPQPEGAKPGLVDAGNEPPVSDTVGDTVEMPHPDKSAAADVYLDGPASVAGLLRLNGDGPGIENEISVRIVHFKVPPEFQLLFRKPFRIKIDSAHGGDCEECYMVVVRHDDAGAVLLDGAGKELRVGRDFMIEHWSSSVSWLVSGKEDAPMLSRGSASPEVAEMQSVLHELGYNNTMNGRYDDSTNTAISRFQKDLGLKPDGLAGPRTLTLLEMVKPGAEGDHL